MNIDRVHCSLGKLGGSGKEKLRKLSQAICEKPVIVISMDSKS
jgi:hypothetical protein